MHAYHARNYSIMPERDFISRDEKKELPLESNKGIPMQCCMKHTLAFYIINYIFIYDIIVENIST